MTGFVKFDQNVAKTEIHFIVYRMAQNFDRGNFDEWASGKF